MSCDDGSNPSPQEAQQSNPGEEEQLNSEVHSSPENGNLNYVDERSVGNLVNCLVLGFYIPVLGYLYDLAFDIHLAREYFTEGHKWYFALTVPFVLVPAVAVTVLGSVWCWRAWKERRVSQPKKSIVLWIVRVILAVLLSSALLRFFEALYCRVMSWRRKKAQTEVEDDGKALCCRMMSWWRKKAPTEEEYEELMPTEDVALLCLFESFMETAPQLVLQLYILVRSATYMGGEGTMSITSGLIKIIASVIILAIAMVIFHRNVRRAVSGAQEISFWASVVHFLAYIGFLSSRVLALSLFASVSAGYLYTLLAGVVVHWAVMAGLIWLHKEKKKFQSMIGNVAFTLVFAAVHIFTFVNPKEGNTRKRYVFYYAVCFAEGIFLMVFWFIATDSALWFRLPALVTYFGAFVVGVLLLIVYHVFLHPVTKGKYAHIFSGESARDSHETTTPNNRG